MLEITIVTICRLEGTSLTIAGISIKEFDANLEQGANLLRDVNTVTHHHMVSMLAKNY